MIVRFDTLNRAERPVFTLCNPGCEYIDGQLTKPLYNLIDHEAEELAISFNSPSELQMRINYLDHGDFFGINQGEIRKIFDAVQNRRLIFVEDIGFFTITNVDCGYEHDHSFKDITAKSIEAELEQRPVPYLSDTTLPFYIDENAHLTEVLPTASRVDDEPEGLLNILLKQMPKWKVGHVDTSVANRYRTFEETDVDANCLSFLTEDVQEAYECIVLFDCVNRRINVYDSEAYYDSDDRSTGIHLTRNDVVNSIHVTEDAEDLCTALFVLGGGDLSIAAVNPLGTNTIYDFTYYLDWMSSQLSAAVQSWMNKYNTNMVDQYRNYVRDYYRYYSNALNIEFEIERLNIILDMYRKCLSNVIAETNIGTVDLYNRIIANYDGDEIEVDDDYSSIEEEVEQVELRLEALIDEYEAKIATAENDLFTANSQVSFHSQYIQEIHDYFDLRNPSNFSPELYEELTSFIFEESYSDENVIVTEGMTSNEKIDQMIILYDKARKELAKKSRPQREYTIDVENFLFAKECEQWSEELETGCSITLEVEPGNIVTLFVSGITVNYDDYDLSITLGSELQRATRKTNFDKVFPTSRVRPTVAPSTANGRHYAFERE